MNDTKPITQAGEPKPRVEKFEHLGIQMFRLLVGFLLMNCRALFGCVIIATLALSPFTVAAQKTAPAPSALALDAYSQGQAYERLFQDHSMPGTCGIVLERARCNADFRTLQTLRGGDPTDGAMETWLATGNLALAVKEWNGMYVPDKAWPEEPEFAWWYTAGLISIATSLPENAATTAYLAHFSDTLADHADSIPAQFRGLQPSTGSPFVRLRPLQAALLEAVPTSPYPDPSLADGTKGDAQLGIYQSTLQELVDNPLALSRPESRAFGLAVTHRLQEINDEYSTGTSFPSVVSALSGEIPSDEAAVNETLRGPLTHSISTKWPIGRRQAFLLGNLIAQVAYNAAVLRDPESDANFRGAVATLPPYAGMSPRVHADIETLQNISYATKGGDWVAINAAASRAVIDMATEP
ncbi:MAG TPA: hypothetical protein VMS32_00050 [Verrucomicrobiae bacterium]|nr:hypothetical protein [Verrucomicrobiae bacterium]